jgi:hypothetical protein
MTSRCKAAGATIAHAAVARVRRESLWMNVRRVIGVMAIIDWRNFRSPPTC